MPAPIIAAGIGAAGSLLAGKSKSPGVQGLAPAILQGGLGIAGSALASRGASQAAETQQQAAAEALAFEREKEKRRQFEYDQQQEALKAQHEAEQRRSEPYRRAAASVLARYGIQVPIEDEPFTPTPEPFGGPAAVEPLSQGLAPEVAASEQGGYQPMTLGQLGEWQRWSNYAPR